MKVLSPALNLRLSRLFSAQILTSCVANASHIVMRAQVLGHARTTPSELPRKSDFRKQQAPPAIIPCSD
jgi:hypothetical protein